MVKRKLLTRLQRSNLFESHNGICCICGAAIGMKPWLVEHMVALEFGGADEVSNMGPAHIVPCARIKTAVEWRRKTKADRQHANYVGAKKRKGRPMAGTIASGWKKKMDGTVVRR